MAKKQMTSHDPDYAIRRPGRPKKTEPVTSQVAQPGEGHSPGLRFEMRLPPGLIADLELMREHTGNSAAVYIRQAILRALAQDKKEWIKK